MTVLGADKAKFKKRIVHFFLLIAVVSVAVIVLNVLLAVFRTDATHTAFLIINIVTDIALFWGIIYAVVAVINPKRKLLTIYERGENSGKSITGKVVEISEKPEMFQGFTCRAVTVETDDGNYELYLIEGGIELKAGIGYGLKTVENLIIFAEEGK